MIELLSESETLEGLKSKMADRMSNGALLAWLVDRYERQVLVYRPGHKPERVTGSKVTGEGPVNGFDLNLASVWECYED